MKVYAHARERRLVVATPNVTVVEWWRGKTDRREQVWRGLLIEPASDQTLKLAGLALGRVRGATAIDAIVAAFAAERTGIVYTSDVSDFEALHGFFPSLRIFAI
jgi:predicted nucleic acid-binding protein